MSNRPEKYRLPRILTPWEAPANGNEENTDRYLLNAIRSLESNKQSNGDFNLSGATEGDVLVANGSLVFVPRKTVPFSFGVGTNLSVTGNLIVTGTAAISGAVGASGNVSIGGNLLTSGTATVTGDVLLYDRLVLSGAPEPSATLPRLQIGNPLVGGDSHDGTFIGVNAASGWFGDFLNFQVDGTSYCRVFAWVNEGFPRLYLGGSNPGVAGVFNRAATGATLYFGEDADTGGVTFRGTGGVEISATAASDRVSMFVHNQASNGTTNFAKIALGPHNGYSATVSPGLMGYNVGNDAGLIFETYDGALFVRGVISPGGLWGIGDVDNNDPASLLHVSLVDSVTSAISIVQHIGHNSTGTPAAGFGSELRFILKTSTTNDRDAGGLSYEWETETEGSQVGLGRLTAYYITTPREVMQWGANSTVPMIGFLGAAKAVQQTGGAATAGAAYGATEQGMLQAAYDALRTFGFLS